MMAVAHIALDIVLVLLAEDALKSLDDRAAGALDLFDARIVVAELEPDGDAFLVGERYHGAKPVWKLHGELLVSILLQQPAGDAVFAGLEFLGPFVPHDGDFLVGNRVAFGINDDRV